MENIQRANLEIDWVSNANRFIKKINERRDELLKIYGENSEAESLLVMNSLETRIHDMFPAFNNKQMSVRAVEEEISHQIKIAETEGEKEIYKQILAMVRSSRGPIF